MGDARCMWPEHRYLELLNKPGQAGEDQPGGRWGSVPPMLSLPGCGTPTLSFGKVLEQQARDQNGQAGAGKVVAGHRDNLEPLEQSQEPAWCRRCGQPPGHATQKLLSCPATPASLY